MTTRPEYTPEYTPETIAACPFETRRVGSPRSLRRTATLTDALEAVAVWDTEGGAFTITGPAGAVVATITTYPAAPDWWADDPEEEEAVSSGHADTGEPSAYVGVQSVDVLYARICADIRAEQARMRADDDAAEAVFRSEIVRLGREVAGEGTYGAMLYEEEAT